MRSATAIRFQIESTLAQKFPSALTPVPKTIRPVMATGIEPLDKLLAGGFPVGAISELFGPECSGRISVALSFLACVTQTAKVCAWIDASNAFDPISAAVSGVDLNRLLWVRCGVLQKIIKRPSQSFSLRDKYLVPTPEKRGLHGGGFGPHPRRETNGLSEAVDGFLRPEAMVPRCAEPQRRLQPHAKIFEAQHRATSTVPLQRPHALPPWLRMEQALRAVDLLLQGGGFSAIVLDFGGISPEYVSRIPLATWFRYRAAAEQTQASVLLLTQHPCSKSSAELLLRLQPCNARDDESTIFTGMKHRIEVVRHRFVQVSTNVVPLRKSPQSAMTASWESQTTWIGPK